MFESFAQSMRGTVILGATLALAACASSPREVSRPSPHYKLGAPYEIDGRRYVPREDPTYDVVGTASWYGDQFHGKATANGEIFDKRRLSAAHTTLPLPSLVEVENLENGKRAVVRVNDRGPFVGDRIIDLSHASAIALGFEREGLARVRVRYVGRAELYAQAPRLGEREASRAARPAASQPQIEPRGATAPTLAAAAPSPLPTPVTEDSLPPVAAETKPPVGAGPIPMEPATGEVWIVLDEFDDLAAVEITRSVVGPTEQTRITSPGKRARYSFEIGPYSSVAAAEARLTTLREAGYLEARVVAKVSK